MAQKPRTLVELLVKLQLSVDHLPFDEKPVCLRVFKYLNRYLFTVCPIETIHIEFHDCILHSFTINITA